MSVRETMQSLLLREYSTGLCQVFVQHRSVSSLCTAQDRVGSLYSTGLFQVFVQHRSVSGLFIAQVCVGSLYSRDLCQVSYSGGSCYRYQFCLMVPQAEFILQT